MASWKKKTSFPDGLFILLCILIGYSQVSSQTIQINKQGKASFYASKFEGRKTANGEIFSNSNFTAAHKTLPFNTFVKVTNPNNNKTVFVRINDRGPHVKGREIDLTRAAAKKIGIVSQGILSVVILEPVTTLLTHEIDSTFNAKRFSDCFGNTDSISGTSLFLWKTKYLQHMLYMANDLDENEHMGRIIIERNGKWYYLLLCDFKSKSEARIELKKLVENGFLKAALYETLK